MSSALKLVLVGESGVGKTSFINAIQNKDIERIKSTIDAEFHAIVVNYRNKPLTLSIFDFGGKPQYRFMQSSHLKGVYGIILMFDLSNETSFRKLYDWMKFLQPVVMGYPNFPIVLIGNKTDLNDEKVREEDINKFIKTYNIAYYEKISVKDRINILDPVPKLVYSIMVFYMEFQKKALMAKQKIETLLKEAEESQTNEILEEIKREETKIDIITPMRHVIEDMVSLNLREVRKDLQELRTNIRRTFQIVFSPPRKRKKSQPKVKPEPIKKEIVKPEPVKTEIKKEEVKKLKTFKVLKSESLREGKKEYFETSIDE